MSIWHQDRIPGVVARHALGLWLPRRKLASAAFVPGMRARRQFYGARPYWYVFDFVLAASDTGEARNAVPADFILLSMMVSASVGGDKSNPGYRIQLLDSKRKRRFSIIGFNDSNFAGNAQNPFVLRKPYRFHSGSTILVRLQNLQTSSNTAQVVLYGVQEAA